MYNILTKLKSQQTILYSQINWVPKRTTQNPRNKFSKTKCPHKPHKLFEASPQSSLYPPSLYKKISVKINKITNLIESRYSSLFSLHDPGQTNFCKMLYECGFFGLFSLALIKGSVRPDELGVDSRLN